MRPKLYHIFVGVFVVLILCLLVGQRLGFVYAGGTGYQAPMSLMVSEVRNGSFAFSYPRGSAIETGAGQWIQLSNGPMVIWMYENTRLEIKTLTKDRVELLVPKGRLIVANNVPPEREVVVMAGGTTVRLEKNQVLSIVNYDFLNKVDVFPLDESFQPGAAADFYAWYATGQIPDDTQE